MLDLTDEDKLISIQTLSKKLRVSIRTISRWNTEASLLNGSAKNGFPRVFTYLYGRKGPRWKSSDINSWITTQNIERNIRGEFVRAISPDTEFDIKGDALMSIKDICQKLDISSKDLRGLRKGSLYYGGKYFIEPTCYLNNGLSPLWSARKVSVWITSLASKTDISI